MPRRLQIGQRLQENFITRCTREEYLYSIPKSDLIELLEHCEEHIPIGSIYSNALFKCVRGALEKQKNFLGLGDLDIRSSFTILTGNSRDDVETANIMAMVQSAPLEAPTQEQYPNKFQYLRAKMRWEMSIKLAAERKDSGERRD
jgi:hypothetical protein